MPNPVNLAQGDHEVLDPAVEWTAHFVDASPPAVELIASIQSGPRQTSLPIRGQTATSLAIRMDARVALNLYRRIGELARTMGWPLPTEDAAQAGFQTYVSDGPHPTPKHTK